MRSPLGSRGAALGMFGVGMATAMGGQMASIRRQKFDPSKLYRNGEKGLWLDQSDISTAFQDSTGTTPQSATGQPTGLRLDKSGRGNGVLQATSTSRPTYTVANGISSDRLDGVDDGYSTSTFASGSLGAAMDCSIALKRATTANMVICSQAPADGGFFFGVCQSGSPTLAVSSAGTAWTAFVDGVQIGGTNTTTRDQLNTALGSGAYHVLEIRDLNLAAWTKFTVGLYTSFMLNADIAGLVLCPSQSADTRAQVRAWLGAKVGLSL